MNETEDTKSRSINKQSRRPAMRLYTPPTHSIKKSDSFKDDLRSNGLKSNEDRNRNHKIDDKLSDCFKRSLNLNDSSRASTSKSTSPQPASEEEFSNMLEIYDLSPELKSQDIRTSLHQLQSGDYEIRWVNDSHAIIIFSTRSIAEDALRLPCHNLKLRKLSQGSAESKQKARQCTDNLPFKQRPETSAILARRLVSGALGIRVSLSAEQREAERKQLKDARGKLI